MKPQATIMYPTIFTRDTDGGYSVSSPNIPGMHTDGDSMQDAAYWAVDAIATMLDGEADYPEPVDPSDWALTPAQSVVFVSVDMRRWWFEKARETHPKTVRRTITVPQYRTTLPKRDM